MPVFVSRIGVKHDAKEAVEMRGLAGGVWYAGDERRTAWRNLR
jgi:hypothetical protein